MIEHLRHQEGAAKPVMVDSSVWITATRRPASAVADELRLLLERDEVATTEVVIAEVLQGSRREEEFRQWSDRLDALHFFSADLEIWTTAAHISFELKNQGLITPLADLVVAAVALAHELPLYSVDEHFSRVPGLRSYALRNFSVPSSNPESEETTKETND